MELEALLEECGGLPTAATFSRHERGEKLPPHEPGGGVLSPALSSTGGWRAERRLKPELLTASPRKKTGGARRTLVLLAFLLLPSSKKWPIFAKRRVVAPTASA